MVKVDGIRSVEALREKVHEGAEPEYLLFYGHTPSKSGRVTASCLSQWWVDPFEVDGVVYPTAEHYMMAGKAELFGDHEKAELIREAPDPKTAKVLGREVAEYDAAVWERHRFDIVVDGNLAKFGAHRDLRRFLLGHRRRRARRGVEEGPRSGAPASPARRRTRPSRTTGGGSTCSASR